MKSWLFTAICCLAIATVPSLAQACKYSVRDVGFVDLGAEPYRLVCVADGANGQDRVTRAVKRVLADSNLRLETLDAVANHPALRSRGTSKGTNTPRLLFLAPDSREIAFEVGDVDLDDDQKLEAALIGLVKSSLRDAILETSLESYAVVVLIEGTSKQENRRATDAARFAVEQINKLMPSMDKPVDGPPKVITLSTDQATQERVLLWSWGVEEERGDDPSIVVLFGRGRRLGPVMTGSDIGGTELLERLRLVGKSCECELDRSWMQGPMFPHTWNASQQADAAKVLGFDAESPLVKVEISRIIARGPRNRRADEVVDVDAIDPLLGYGEIDVDTEPLPAETPPVETPRNPAPKAEVVAADETVPPPPDANDGRSDTAETTSLTAGRSTAVTIGVILIVALGGGLLMFLRMRGQA